MLYVLNHKNHLKKDEIIRYRNSLEKFPQNSHVVFAPVACYLPYFEGYPLASQDISSFPEGPSTGEIAPQILKSLGVSYSIIGHSERRKNQHEDNSILRKKIEAAFHERIIPIFCIGEGKEDYLNGNTKTILEEQMNLLFTFPKEVLQNIIIAYEPVWAIGSGVAIQKEALKELLKWIKEKTDCQVLYGGSVDLDIIASFKDIEELDGFLIGGMSLEIDKVLKLLSLS